MYAVVRINSHQYRVEPGQVVCMEKINAPVGSELRFKDILMIADNDNIQCGTQVKGSVTGTVTAQEKGNKILAFKRKRRKGFKKTIGHRQLYTQVKITGIEA